MTNSEKYLKDGVNTGNFMFALDSSGIIKERNESLIIYASELQYFLNQPAKPTLTEDEKVILRNIDIEHYQRIGRVKKGLYVANAVTRYYIKPFEPAFQFIKSRRRI